MMKQKRAHLYYPSGNLVSVLVKFSYPLKHGKGMMGFICVLPIYAVGIYFVPRLIWAAALETVRALIGRQRRQ